MVPKINYLEANDMIEQQKKAVYERIQAAIHSSKDVYPGLDLFEGGNKIDPLQVPGLCTSL
jgi:hypothetical protein